MIVWAVLVGGALPLWAATNDFIPGEGFNTLHMTPTRQLSQIVWRTNQLIYRTGAIDNWEEDIVTTTDYPVTPPNPIEADESNCRYRDQAVLLLDSTGVPHVFVQRWFTVEHFWRDSGGWQAEDLTSDWSSSVWPMLGQTRNLSVEVGPGDTFHLVMNDYNVMDDGRLLYASNKTGVWVWEVAVPSIGNPARFQYVQSQYAPRTLAVAADSSNCVCVVFCPRYNYPINPDGTCLPDSELHCAMNGSGIWRDELINAPADRSGDAGLGASIAHGPDQQPRIASLYVERVDTGSPQYAQLLFHTRDANGTWTKEVIASSAAGYVAGDGNEGTGFAPYLHYDFAGVPHIAFSDFASQHFWFGADEFAGQIRYAKKAGASWSIQTIFAQTDPLRNMLNNPVLAVGSNQLFFAGLQRIDYLDADLMIIDQEFNLVMFDQSPPAAPFITTQPRNETVFPGATMTNRVVAVGSAPLKYQWRWDATNLSGATNAMLVLTNVQAANTGGYAIAVNNAYGSVTSVVATLTLAPALTILTQPTNQTIVAGETATFTVAVTGSLPMSYQWRFYGTNLAGQTLASLVLIGVTTNQAGPYAVVVTNHYASVTSSMATLTVVPEPGLGEALDAPQLLWTTGGNALWKGQTSVAHDGQDAAQSGTISDSQMTWLETSMVGPGSLSFWWKLSSEWLYDCMEFFTNGVWVAGITGEVDWEVWNGKLGPGTQVLRWRYTKDSSGSSGQDRGWVDQVSFAPVSVRPIIMVNDGSFGVRTNRFGFNVSGTAGQVVVVEGSTNLSTWLPFQTNTLGSGPFYFSDPSTAAFPWRFYRARQLP